ncbi:hypothetical protein NM952_08530 [Pasteurella multocida subsp. multocida]|uniref:hypothetical protein n=1 Tax=Pasteurella multocida TaxID=747 RepID=UPI00189BB066|nr:hypothetical protein [Pasteurella multocida]MBF6981130.1 hypothetical protein [Pasteurella multocida]MDA5618639.1 hypothetical protein [Pasteurella multocida subsp. multocida]MDA5621305.1 hypothetical protein [Pasteurella multocida subsp. multocida]
MTIDLDKPMDYSKCNAIEIKAISIATQKLGLGYPYFGEALNVLAEEFSKFPLESLNGLKILHDELGIINKHLLEMAPKPPSLIPEEMVKVLTHDEIIDGLLKHGVIHSLVNTFSYFQENISMRIAELENGISKEGVNEQIN